MERVRRIVVGDSSAAAEELTYEKIALIVAIACHEEERVAAPSPLIELLKSKELSYWGLEGRTEQTRH